MHGSCGESFTENLSPGEQARRGHKLMSLLNGDPLPEQQHAPPPYLGRSFPIAGLFCPCCTQGEPCAFHHGPAGTQATVEPRTLCSVANATLRSPCLVAQYDEKQSMHALQRLSSPSTGSPHSSPFKMPLAKNAKMLFDNDETSTEAGESETTLRWERESEASEEWHYEVLRRRRWGWTPRAANRHTDMNMLISHVTDVQRTDSLQQSCGILHNLPAQMPLA